jgi:hypothetical protein
MKAKLVTADNYTRAESDVSSAGSSSKALDVVKE